jgi:hypothetical protein
MINFTSCSLYPRVSTEYDAGWAPWRVWTFGKEKNLLTLQGFEPQTVLKIA